MCGCELQGRVQIEDQSGMIERSFILAAPNNGQSVLEVIDAFWGAYPRRSRTATSTYVWLKQNTPRYRRSSGGCPSR